MINILLSVDGNEHKFTAESMGGLILFVSAFKLKYFECQYYTTLTITNQKGEYYNTVLKEFHESFSNLVLSKGKT